jgi:hypothetical protein
MKSMTLEDNEMKEKNGKNVKFQNFKRQVFTDVDIVIYLISLSDYDEFVYEATESTNRMVEALDCFSQTINGEWFAKTPIVLLFNKQDVLEKKMSVKDSLKETFPKYEGFLVFKFMELGGQDAKEAQAFIMDLFKSQIKGDVDRVKVLSVFIINNDCVEDGFKVIQEITKNLMEKKSLKLFQSK